MLDPNVLAAVLEAYAPEGVVVWCTGWILADPAKRRRMEAGVLAEWSGHWPLPVPATETTKENDNGTHN